MAKYHAALELLYALLNDLWLSNIFGLAEHRPWGVVVPAGYEVGVFYHCVVEVNFLPNTGTLISTSNLESSPRLLLLVAVTTVAQC